MPQSVLTLKETINNLIKNGSRLLNDGEYLQANEVFREAIALNPTSSRAHNGLGYAQLMLKQSALAKSSFYQSIESDNSFPDPHLGLCLSLTQLGEFEELHQAATLGAALFPSTPDFYIYLQYLNNQSINKRPTNLWPEIVQKIFPDHPLASHLENTLKEFIEGSHFQSHYHQWRIKRLHKIITLLNPLWFENKNILELGCGYGDIGMHLSTLNASVTLSDARQEHLSEIKRRYPHFPSEHIVPADINSEWPFTKNFDLCLHLGLLYHLKNWQFGLQQAFKNSHILVLETEVCDSDDPSEEVSVQENGFDKAVGNTGIRPSAPKIESFLSELGYSYQRHDSPELNSGPHRYDWKVQNTKLFGPRFRRFWICTKK